MSMNGSVFEEWEVYLLKNDLCGLNDVYKDIADEIGLENTLAIFKLFRGTHA